MKTRIHSVIARTLTGAIAILSLVSGVGYAADTIGFSIEGARGKPSVRVLDEQTLQPLAGATAEVTLRPSGWASLTMPSAPTSEDTWGVTVRHPGYETLTLLGVQNSEVTAYLRPLSQPEDILASGIMRGWQGDGGGNRVEAELVVRAFSAVDLLHFNLSSVISPLKDTIDVYGTRNVPSNLTFSKQDPSYMLVPFHLDKSGYRLPLERNRTQRLVAAEGIFNVGEVAPSLQGGKVSLEILNQIRFRKVGFTSYLDSQSDFAQDVEVTIPLVSMYQVQVSRAPFAADVLVAAVTDVDGDRRSLVPTDLKLAGQKSKISLTGAKAAFGKSQHVLALALATNTGQKGKVLSGILADPVGAVVETGDFLPLPEIAAKSVKVEAPGHGIAIVQSPSLGTVIALPEAGVLTIPSDGAATSVIHLEFGGSFDSHKVDGTTVLRALKRFARTTVEKP